MVRGNCLHYLSCLESPGSYFTSIHYHLRRAWGMRMIESVYSSLLRYLRHQRVSASCSDYQKPSYLPQHTDPSNCQRLAHRHLPLIFAFSAARRPAAASIVWASFAALRVEWLFQYRWLPHSFDWVLFVRRENCRYRLHRSCSSSTCFGTILASTYYKEYFERMMVKEK